MSDYRKSKQHIEGVQNQKNSTEARCANQRQQLALMNTQIKNYRELLKECREFFYENLIDTEFHFSCGLGSDIKKQSCIRSLSKLKTKIDEVLK